MNEPAAPEDSHAPLTGLRIVAVEQFGAGPFGTLLLADLGAEVIKIEDPAAGGDVGRTVPPGAADGSSLYFEAFNRGKRSIALDLTSPGGREVFSRLVATADAVYNNLRGDLPDRLGLTYAALSEINPAIVCVSLSAYGREDPRRAEPGYDALVQAEAGWASLTGEPGSPPARSGLPMADYAAGLVAACGLLAGIVDARRTGRGRDLDTSLFDTALAMLSYQATWWLSAGIETAAAALFGAPEHRAVPVLRHRRRLHRGRLREGEVFPGARSGHRHAGAGGGSPLRVRSPLGTSIETISSSSSRSDFASERPPSGSIAYAARCRVRRCASFPMRSTWSVSSGEACWPRTSTPARHGAQRRAAATGFRIHPELPRIAGPRRRRGGSPGRARI